MTFDVKSFAAQVRPSNRPSPEPFAGSILDAGSPKYVRPEDLFLDIQGRLFDVTRQHAKDLGGIDPGNFERRWMSEAPAHLSLRKIGNIRNDLLAESLMNLLRSPKRKNEKFPTMLPLVPSLGYYKNIKPNLPNFLNDQFRPALTFADEVGYLGRLHELKDKLGSGTHADDRVKELAHALLPRLTPSNTKRPSSAATSSTHVGPLLKDFSHKPSLPLAVSDSFRFAIDTLLALEPKVPRILWIRWLTAAMRVWLPLFFMRRCAVTASAARLAKSALYNGRVPHDKLLTADLLGPKALLRGSKEWLGQLSPIIQNYVRARFELSILLDLSNLLEELRNQKVDPLKATHASRARELLDRYELDRTQINTLLPPATGEFLGKKDPIPRKISMPGDSGNDRLALGAWFEWMVVNQKAIDALAKIIGADDALDLVEKVYSYVRPEYEPLRSGFGKNALEYVAFTLGAPRKADRDPEFPDEFSLLYRGEGGRRARQVQVSPGPQLLGMLIQLVSYQSSINRTSSKLSDLLDMLDSLGIDFRSNPEDFEILKSELLRLGLLR